MTRNPSTSSSHGGAFRAAALVVALVVVAVTAAFSASALASTDAPEQTFSAADVRAAADEVFAATNEDRVAAGRAPLVRDADLDRFAGVWSDELARRSTLEHRDRLGERTADVLGADGWSVTGENVGRGGSAEAVADAFLASPDHRVNVLDATFSRVGVAVSVTSDGELFVAVNFVG